MKYSTTKHAPTEMTNFIGLTYEVSKIDGDEPYPVCTKIYQRQDGTFDVGGAIVDLEVLEETFESFMFCEAE